MKITVVDANNAQVDTLKNTEWELAKEIVDMVEKEIIYMQKMISDKTVKKINDAPEEEYGKYLCVLGEYETKALGILRDTFFEINNAMVDKLNGGEDVEE